jgi:predicted secreted protein
MAELIETKVGEVFEIPLQATPTAGFRWELSFPTEAADLVDFVGTEWRQVQPGLIGGSAAQIFRFNAMAPGELTLVFEYRRPWEVSETKRRAVHVRIALPNASHGSTTIAGRPERDRTYGSTQTFSCSMIDGPAHDGHLHRRRRPSPATHRLYAETLESDRQRRSSFSSSSKMSSISLIIPRRVSRDW